MSVKKKLCVLYHFLLKRDVVGPIGLSKYEYFGINTILYKPVVIDHNKFLIGIADNKAILTRSKLQLFNNNSHIRIDNERYFGYSYTLLDYHRIWSFNG